MDAGEDKTAVTLVCCDADAEIDWPALEPVGPVTTPLGLGGRLLGPPYGWMTVPEDELNESVGITLLADVPFVAGDVMTLGEDPGLPLVIAAFAGELVDPPYAAGPPGVVEAGVEVVEGGAVYTVLTSAGLVAKIAETPGTKVVPVTLLNSVQSPEVPTATQEAIVSHSSKQASTVVVVCLPAT